MQETSQVSVAPLMLRVYNQGCKGATAFFRNRPFLDEFFRLLTAEPANSYSILVHASSIGAEPYSLAMWWLHKFRKPGVRLTIHATDINANFLAMGRSGTYPLEVLNGMSSIERTWFDIADKSISVSRSAKELVKFLEPMSFLDENATKVYDAVLVMNALTYVTPQQQNLAIRNISRQTRYVLGLTAFHPDSIRRDLRENDFAPHLNAIESIHSSWGDRLTNLPIDRSSAEYSWRLPPFDPNIPEADYRFCSLFTRSSTTEEVAN